MVRFTVPWLPQVVSHANIFWQWLDYPNHFSEAKPSQMWNFTKDINLNFVVTLSYRGTFKPTTANMSILIIIKFLLLVCYCFPTLKRSAIATICPNACLWCNSTTSIASSTRATGSNRTRPKPPLHQQTTLHNSLPPSSPYRIRFKSFARLKCTAQNTSLQLLLVDGGNMESGER